MNDQEDDHDEVDDLQPQPVDEFEVELDPRALADQVRNRRTGADRLGINLPPRRR